MQHPLISYLGPKLKVARKTRGLTMVQVADQAGITKGMLSKIENGRTIPSLPVLMELIKVLEIDPGPLFAGMQEGKSPNYLVVRKDEHHRLKKEDGAVGFKYNLIFNGTMKSQPMEVVLLEIEPGSTRKKVSVDAWEFKYILQGEVDYVIDNETIHLKAGDTLFYDGNQPHVPMNRGTEVLRMLVIYFYKEGGK